MSGNVVVGKLKLNTGKLFLTGMLFMATNLFSRDPNFYIYLCFGQSNMEGQGTIEQQDETVDSRFRVMEAVDCPNLGRTKGNWYTAVPPLCRCWSGLSPADYFGRTMADSLPGNIRIGIINVSVAGCKIELFDKDHYQDYVSTITEDWLKNIIDAYDGNPYGYLVSLAKMAQQDGVIRGILLHQGESNTGDAGWPSKVGKIYLDLIDDLGLDPDSVPLLAGEVVHADQGGVCASMNTIIAALPEVISNAYVISSSGCSAGPDNLHFNSAGYRELGRRYALQMLELTETGQDADTASSAIGTRAVPDGFALRQNRPNPFARKTGISFELPDYTFVSLKVYDVAGVEIEELAGRAFGAGSHTLVFEPGPGQEGCYFYTIRTGGFAATRKMMKLAE